MCADILIKAKLNPVLADKPRVEKIFVVLKTLATIEMDGRKREKT